MVFTAQKSIVYESNHWSNASLASSRGMLNCHQLTLQLDVNTLSSTKEIDEQFSKAILQMEKDETTRLKLMKLPIRKKWDYLRTKDIKVKTIGDMERERKENMGAYLDAIEKPTELSIELLQKLTAKIETMESIDLKIFLQKKGMSRLFDCLSYYLYHKIGIEYVTTHFLI